VSALLTAMQGGVALGAVALPVNVLRQSCSAVKTARSDYMLNQAWQAGPGNVERRAGSISVWDGPRAGGRWKADRARYPCSPLLVLSVVVHYLYPSSR